MLEPDPAAPPGGCTDSAQCPDDATCDPATAACVPQQPWGAFAAALDVPACPPGPVLVVDTTSDELDGPTTLADPLEAGPTLSLVEALWIADNRPGPDTITFDAAVFPVEAPATILFSGQRVVPSPSLEVCLDGRGRGVVLDWAPAAQPQPEDRYSPSPYLPTLGTGSLWVGLTLLRVPSQLFVFDTAQLAGCAGRRRWRCRWAPRSARPSPTPRGRRARSAN